MSWAATASPAEVAALAPHVLEVAGAGDVVARGILDYAARELSQLAICLQPQLGERDKISVALAGGLLEASTPLRGVVLAKLAEHDHFTVVDTPIDAALGALAIAKRPAP